MSNYRSWAHASSEPWRRLLLGGFLSISQLIFIMRFVGVTRGVLGLSQSESDDKTEGRDQANTRAKVTL